MVWSAYSAMAHINLTRFRSAQDWMYRIFVLALVIVIEYSTFYALIDANRRGACKLGPPWFSVAGPSTFRSRCFFGSRRILLRGPS